MASPAQTNPPLPERVPIIHNLAMAGTILTPLVMLLPPRKMDLRFLVLAGTFSLSSNQLAYEYTGTPPSRSRCSRRISLVFSASAGSVLRFEKRLPKRE